MQLQYWLTNQNIKWHDNMQHEGLGKPVKKLREQNKASLCDKLAAEQGHLVVRPPLYHSALNPTKLNCSQVKVHVARNNPSYKIGDVYYLLLKGVQKSNA